MSEEFGSDFITIVDDEGNEYELELLDTIEINDQVYMACLPAEELTTEDQSYEMVILRVVEENGEQYFEDIEDENELDMVYEQFMTQLFENEDERFDFDVEEDDGNDR